MEKEFESLQKDWVRLAADMSKTWKDIVAYSKSEAGAKKAELKKEMEKRLDDLREDVEATVKKGEKAVNAVSAVVEEHPMKSLLVAFGLGLLVSKLMERKSN